LEKGIESPGVNVKRKEGKKRMKFQKLRNYLKINVFGFLKGLLQREKRGL